MRLTGYLVGGCGMELDGLSLDSWISNFNSTIDSIVQNLYNDNQLKELIASIKKTMFENNTHGWGALKPKTIANKKSLAKGGYIDAGDIYKPLVRTKDLVNAFSDSTNIEIDSDFNISYNLTDVQATKIKNNQELGRNPEEITSKEYAAVVEFVVNQIVNQIQAKYNGV